MQLRHLSLTDFRGYEHAEVSLGPGLTAIVGANGEGKTNLLEAVGYLASLSSFRSAPTEALVRNGADQAVLRADGDRSGRQLLIEAEVSRTGRGRVLVNHQRLARSRDLLGALRVTIFSPDDLVLVKGGPAERRRYLDDVLVAARPRNDALRTDLDRILRQRNALLRQARGHLTPEVASTLQVWNTKLVETGEALATARDELVTALAPRLARAYEDVSNVAAQIEVSYVAPWRADGLAEALKVAERDELRRGVSLVGPHRDDLALSIAGLPARTHASQGEQRSLALALRLASHHVVSDAASCQPILLLDDVFSELDPGRSRALLEHLPPGQTLLTTAAGVPTGAEPELVLEVAAGMVRPVEA